MSESQVDDDEVGSILPSSSSGSLCPICQSYLRDENALWRHINFEHISRRTFPSISFLEAGHRRLCAVCGFSYARRWKTCRRSNGNGHGRCEGTML